MRGTDGLPTFDEPVTVTNDWHSLYIDGPTKPKTTCSVMG